MEVMEAMAGADPPALALAWLVSCTGGVVYPGSVPVRRGTPTGVPFSKLCHM